MKTWKQENKKTRKKERKQELGQETDQENDQEKKNVSFFLGHFLGRERVFFLFSWSHSWSSFCILTFLFSFINSHLWSISISVFTHISLSPKSVTTSEWSCLLGMLKRVLNIKNFVNDATDINLRTNYKTDHVSRVVIIGFPNGGPCFPNWRPGFPKVGLSFTEGRPWKGILFPERGTRLYKNRSSPKPGPS